MSFETGSTEDKPTALLMYLGMVLSGLGTTLAGPVLPLLAAHWHLRDSQAGLLLTAQFIGLSIGSVAISPRLARGLVCGIFLSLAGFGGLAMAVRGGALHADPAFSGQPFGTGVTLPCLALFVAGLGLGQMITAINLIAGKRYRSRRGSALSLVNFFWSLGAVLSPLLAAWLTPRFSLQVLLGFFAGGFLLLGTEAVRQLLHRTAPGVLAHPGLHSHQLPVEEAAIRPSASGPSVGISGRSLVYFAALFFLYGGIESSLNGWLTTYAVRFGRHGLSVSELSTVLFWVALTSGRGLSSLLLLHVTERVLRIGSLLGAVLVTGALIWANTLTEISVCSVLLGLCLAPCFPATLSLLLERGPRARQAGLALAVTGLGGAALAWMMGQVSTLTGSLHTALWLPLAGAGFLLILSLGERPEGSAENPQPV